MCSKRYWNFEIEIDWSIGKDLRDLRQREKAKEERRLGGFRSSSTSRKKRKRKKKEEKHLSYFQEKKPIREVVIKWKLNLAKSNKFFFEKGLDIYLQIEEEWSF